VTELNKHNVCRKLCMSITNELVCYIHAQLAVKCYTATGGRYDKILMTGS